MDSFFLTSVYLWTVVNWNWVPRDVMIVTEYVEPAVYAKAVPVEVQLALLHGPAPPRRMKTFPTAPGLIAAG